MDENEKPLFKIDVFEGPLDLLLHLISKHKLDIKDIPIFDLVEQYISYVEMMKEENIEIASEFLEMAARLVYIKTASLLPVYKEAEELKKELSGELIEYRECKIIASRLLTRFIATDRIVRPPMEIKEDHTYTRVHDVLELFLAYRNISFKKTPQKPKEDIFNDLVKKEVISVSDTIKKVNYVLIKSGKTRVFDIFSRSKSKGELVAYFLAVLEMARNGQIHLEGEGKEMTAAAIN